MSKQSALEFAAKASEDQALRDKVRAMGESYSDERVANAIAVGQNEGFDFTEDEFKAVVSEAKAGESGELQEADLEAVVGGAAWYAHAWAAIVKLMNGGGGDEFSTDNAVAGVRG